MESSFRAQISTVQYPSLAYIFACLFVCLKLVQGLVQFVVLWSQKEKPLILKGAEMPRELIKIQRGEEDGDAQNVPVRLQRVLLLAVCTAEGLIYC